MDATPTRPMSREVGYGIEDVLDDMVGDMKEDKRYHLHTAILVKSEARHVRQAWGQAMDCNRAVHAELQAYQAQVQTHETHIQTRDARIGSLETLVATLMAQTSSFQTQLATTLGRIQTLEAREPARTDDP
ncbi:hypothetical protein Tco_1517255 [Tanacetum coccineum]